MFDSKDSNGGGQGGGANATGGTGAGENTTGGSDGSGGEPDPGDTRSYDECDASRAFSGSLEVLEGFSVSVATDGLTGVASVEDVGGDAIKAVTRASFDQPFELGSTIVDVSDIPDATGLGIVSLSNDGLWLVFSVSFSNYARIYASTRSSTSAAFGAPIVLPAPLNQDQGNGQPWVNPTKTTLYFAAGVIEVGQSTITASSTKPIGTLGAKGEFAGSVPSDAIFSPLDDEKTLFFSSNTALPGESTSTGFHLWRSTRTSAAVLWGPGAVEDLAAVPAYDSANFTMVDGSPNGCFVYFRKNGVIFQTRRAL